MNTCMCVLSRGGAVKDCVLLGETLLLDDLSLVHSQVHVLMCCMSVCACHVLSLFDQCSIFLRVFFFPLSNSNQHDFTLTETKASVLVLYLPGVNMARFLGMVESLLVAKHGAKPCENFSALIGCCRPS